jgi:hypothetical protein
MKLIEHEEFNDLSDIIEEEQAANKALIFY